jgi:ABC-2 type transport system ATP-binding protein
MNAIEMDRVSKRFAAHVAVSNLSFDVPEGAIYGFIGPNGSGKTTTLRMIMRILHPDSGDVRVLGELASGSDAASARVGYLPEERGLYRQMKVRECLRFFAELKGVRRPLPAINAWLERMDLGAWSEKKIIALSKGMSQKVQFIVAVIARPELVLLDEPFSGLDPVGAEALREAVIDLRREGSTVIFSTHDMSMAERMCDFFLMIHKGRKVLDGTLDSIQKAYGSHTARVLLDPPDVVLDGLPGVQAIGDDGRWRQLRLHEKVDTQCLLSALMERGRVLHFDLSRPTLHDIFVRIAGPTAQETVYA